MERLFNIYEMTAKLPARDYFLRQLAAGGCLARQIGAKTEFGRGRFYVALPKDVDESALRNFDSCPFPHVAGAGDETLAHVVKSHVLRADHAVLVQDTLSAITDPEIESERQRGRVVTYNREVYWRISDRDLSDPEILRVLRCGSHYPFSVFFCVGGEPHKKVELDDSGIAEIMRTITGVAVGALDEESFVLWWSSRFPIPFTPGERP
jgi:hypothetical protein